MHIGLYFEGAQHTDESIVYRAISVADPILPLDQGYGMEENTNPG